MKKIGAAALVLIMLFSFCVAFAEGDSSQGEVVSIEMFYSPWASTPYDGVDPYEAYLEEKYGCDFILSPATDFETQLYARAAGDDMPDLILFGNMAQLNNMYSQGILLDDWTDYLANMPQTSANMSDMEKRYLQVDGKIIACPSYPGDQKFSFLLRKDWMETLKLNRPTNDEELLEVLRAFTFNDPDGDGQDNTYGLTAAGGNTSTGELQNLKLLYSPPSFYITPEGEVSHFMLDGGFLKYLKLARTIVSEGLIDPDWYTQGWDERKPNLYAGRYGMCWYPGVALLEESAEAVGMEKVLGKWEMMPMYSGKLTPQPFVGALRSVSAEAGQDPRKMGIITSYLEDCAYPNEEFFVVREGYKIDGYDILTEISDGIYFVGMSSPDNPRVRQYGSIMYGWGQMIQSGASGSGYFFANTPEPNDLTHAQTEYLAQWDASEKYGNEYYLLNPDPTLSTDSSAMIGEFEIDFILGNVEEEDYDAFVQRWMDTYGQQLLDDAVATYQAYGLIQ